MNKSKPFGWPQSVSQLTPGEEEASKPQVVRKLPSFSSLSQSERQPMPARCYRPCTCWGWGPTKISRERALSQDRGL